MRGVRRLEHEPETRLGREVRRERLRAGVEDRAVARRPAHDRRAHGQRDVVERRRSRRDRRAVVERIRACAVLGHGRPQLDPLPTSPAFRPPRPSRPRGRGRSASSTARARKSTASGGRRVGQEAGEAERAEARDLGGQGGRGLRIGDARAAEAGVALDEHAQLAPAARGRAVETGQHAGVVGGDRDRRTLEQAREARQLSLAEHVQRHEQVVHARRRPSPRPRRGSGT